MSPFLFTSLQGISTATTLPLFTCDSLAIIFYSEHVETKELTAKLPILQQSNKILLHQTKSKSIISVASKMM